LVRLPLFGLSYQPRMTDDDDECGAIGEIIDRGTKFLKKSCPSATLLKRKPHDLTRAPTRVATLGNQRLAA
jgi:hypothetical protein